MEIFLKDTFQIENYAEINEIRDFFIIKLRFYGTFEKFCMYCGCEKRLSRNFHITLKHSFLTYGFPFFLINYFLKFLKKSKIKNQVKQYFNLIIFENYLVLNINHSIQMINPYYIVIF